MRHTILFGVAAVLLANSAWAVSYTGSLSTADGGLIGASTWGSNTEGLPTTLQWTVTSNDMAGTWHYSYTFQVPLVSHNLDEIQYVHLETASNFKASDMKNLTFGSLTPSTLDEVGLLHKRGIMPANMFGAQIIHQEKGEGVDVGEEGHILTIDFDTTKAPVWGDFYGNGVDPNEVINAGFTKNDVDPKDAPRDGTVGNNLLVPGAIAGVPSPIPTPPVGGAVPEPLTMLLISLVALPLGRELKRRLNN